jgi:hypothetical protein
LPAAPEEAQPLAPVIPAQRVDTAKRTNALGKSG